MPFLSAELIRDVIANRPAAGSKGRRFTATDTGVEYYDTGTAWAAITVDAGQITSGTLPAARLPNPSASTLGGVESIAAVSHQFLTSISTSGVPAQAQPTEADLSLSDITTNNVSITKHGLAPKAPNDATKFLDGTGAYSTPAASIQQQAYVYAADSGSANAYAVTLSPSPTIIAGSAVVFKATNANTGASTLAVNGGSATAIKKNGSTALVSGDIASGQIVEVVYDGTNFQIVAGGSGSSTANVRFRYDINSGVWIAGQTWAQYDETTYGGYPYLRIVAGGDPSTSSLSRSGWTASATSDDGSNVPANVLDASTSTWWRSVGGFSFPQDLIIDTGSAHTFNAIQINGEAFYSPANYEVYVSDDGSAWGVAITSGTLAAPGVANQSYTITFATQTKRWVKLRSLSSNDLAPLVSEFNLQTVGTPEFDTTNWLALSVVGGGGSVTSVGLTVPSWLSVSGTPVTTSGTLAVTATSGQTANRFLATPDGSTGAAGLRAIAAADLPVATTGAFGAVKPDGSTITISGGVITSTSSGGMTNPMTTAGDTIYGGSSGTPTRLAGGTSGYVLTSNGATSAPSWQASGGSVPTAISSGPDWPPTSAGSLDDEFTGSVFDTARWTWVNQGSATATVANSILALTAPATSGDNNHGIVQTCPATPWEVTAKLWFRAPTTNFADAGILLADATAKQIVFGLFYNSGQVFVVQNWTSVNSISTSPYSAAHPVGVSVFWTWHYLRIKDDGTNLIFSLSPDGVTFQTLTTIGRTAWLASGPTKIGLMCDAKQTTQTVTLSCEWFRRTL